MRKIDIVDKLNSILGDKIKEKNAILPGNKKIFDNTFITLTRLISDTRMREFKDSFKNNVNYFVPSFSKEKLIYQPKFPPSFIGTATDILISYKLNKSHKFELADHVIKRDNVKELWKKVYLEAERTTLYRAGPLAFEGLEKQRNRIKDFVEDFKIIEELVDSQIEKFEIKKMNITFNPVFGSLESGVRADGDFIFDDSLIEVKTSNKPIFSKAYINQLIGYIALNESLKDKYKISSIGYWNPLYGIFYKTSIQDIKPTIELFNKNKNMIVNDIECREKAYAIQKEIDHIKYNITSYKTISKKGLLKTLGKYL